MGCPEGSFNELQEKKIPREKIFPSLVPPSCGDPPERLYFLGFSRLAFRTFPRGAGVISAQHREFHE